MYQRRPLRECHQVRGFGDVFLHSPSFLIDLLAPQCPPYRISETPWATNVWFAATGTRTLSLLCDRNSHPFSKNSASHSTSPSCLLSSRCCEGHECRCALPYLCCLQCFVDAWYQCSVQMGHSMLILTRWTHTPSVMKSQSIFRTKCFFCKAEICHKDVIAINDR